MQRSRGRWRLIWLITIAGGQFYGLPLSAKWIRQRLVPNKKEYQRPRIPKSRLKGNQPHQARRNVVSPVVRSRRILPVLVVSIVRSRRIVGRARSSLMRFKISLSELVLHSIPVVGWLPMAGTFKPHLHSTHPIVSDSEISSRIFQLVFMCKTLNTADRERCDARCEPIVESRVIIFIFRSLRVVHIPIPKGVFRAARSL